MRQQMHVMYAMFHETLFPHCVSTCRRRGMIGPPPWQGARRDRVRQVTLSLTVDNLLSADDFDVLLNGGSLQAEPLARDFGAKCVRTPGRTPTYPPPQTTPTTTHSTLACPLKQYRAARRRTH